jgi:hypothetical protein
MPAFISARVLERAARRQGAMGILGGIPPDAPDDHFVAVGVPFQNRARSEAELLSHRRRNGHLSLRGEF